jgi:hypothetical protein
LDFVAPFAAGLLRVDLSAALRTAAALQLQNVVGARTRSHDDPLSSINQVGENWQRSLVDSQQGGKGGRPTLLPRAEDEDTMVMLAYVFG